MGKGSRMFHLLIFVAICNRDSSECWQRQAAQTPAGFSRRLRGEGKQWSLLSTEECNSNLRVWDRSSLKSYILNSGVPWLPSSDTPMWEVPVVSMQENAELTSLEKLVLLFLLSPNPLFPSVLQKLRIMLAIMFPVLVFPLGSLNENPANTEYFIRSCGMHL